LWEVNDIEFIGNAGGNPVSKVTRDCRQQVTDAIIEPLLLVQFRVYMRLDDGAMLLLRLFKVDLVMLASDSNEMAKRYMYSVFDHGADCFEVKDVEVV